MTSRPRHEWRPPLPPIRRASAPRLSSSARRPLALPAGAMFDPVVDRLSAPDRRRPLLLLLDEAISCLVLRSGGAGRRVLEATRLRTRPACRSRTMTGRRPRTIREQTVDRSLAVLSLYASFSMRPLGYPQAPRGKTGRELGIHVFGPRASELIADASAAMALGASSEDIARTCRPHRVPAGASPMPRSPWPAGRWRPPALRRGPARHFRSEP